jgi:hypothetical protein
VSFIQLKGTKAPIFRNKVVQNTSPLDAILLWKTIYEFQSHVVIPSEGEFKGDLEHLISC